MNFLHHPVLEIFKKARIFLLKSVHKGCKINRNEKNIKKLTWGNINKLIIPETLVLI